MLVGHAGELGTVTAPLAVPPVRPAKTPSEGAAAGGSAAGCRPGEEFAEPPLPESFGVVCGGPMLVVPPRRGRLLALESPIVCERLNIFQRGEGAANPALAHHHTRIFV